MRWHGRNVRKLREEYWKDLVYVGHMNGVKDDLTVRENLRVNAEVAGRPASPARLADALDRVGLSGFEDRMARFLSQGQRRRIALARLYVSDDRAAVDPRRAVHRARREGRRPACRR